MTDREEAPLPFPLRGPSCREVQGLKEVLVSWGESNVSPRRRPVVGVLREAGPVPEPRSPGPLLFL